MGFVALVVPLVVHRLSRRPPDVVRFPSLSLLDTAPLRPTQRARLDDRWLLLLRCAMLATVVAGLTQPVWSTHGTASQARRIAPSTVILVDTSAQLSATDARGTVDAPPQRWLVTADQLRHELLAAVAWLRTRPAPRVVELRSDVPAWALDSVDLASLPSDVTLRLVLQPPSMASRSTSIVSRASDTLLPLAADAREAWWNALAARQHLLSVLPPSGLKHAAPVSSNADTLPLLFNQRGETAVAAHIVKSILQLTTATATSNIETSGDSTTAGHQLRRALSPTVRAVHTQRETPLRGVYHAPETLNRWAALASGPALGPSTSGDVHQQDTLARWFWGAALILLALEQWLRSRARE